jgi:hypothetical protein
MQLWHEGGIYMDSKFVFNDETDWLDFENDEFIICISNLLIVNQSIIIMTQYHPLALLMIKEIIENV